MFDRLGHFTKDRRLGVAQVTNTVGTGAPLALDKTPLAQVGLAEDLADRFVPVLQHVHAEQSGTLDHGRGAGGPVDADQDRGRVHRYRGERGRGKPMGMAIVIERGDQGYRGGKAAHGHFELTRQVYRRGGFLILNTHM
ncbi:hypothetical protein D3C86_1745620 [compost metagenome]